MGFELMSEYTIEDSLTFDQNWEALAAELKAADETLADALLPVILATPSADAATLRDKVYKAAKAALAQEQGS
jgi:deoxyribose-phosphate aldolase